MLDGHPLEFISEEVKAQYNEPPVMYHPDFIIMRMVYFDDDGRVVRVDPHTYTHKKAITKIEWEFTPIRR